VELTLSDSRYAPRKGLRDTTRHLGRINLGARLMTWNQSAKGLNNHTSQRHLSTSQYLYNYCQFSKKSR
jgi:hypothetical protein